MSAQPATARASTLPSPAPPPPRIPLYYIEAPTQRLYALGAIVALQAYKLADGAECFWTAESSFTDFVKWICLDLAWICLVPWLRIPRFTFNRNAMLTLMLGLGLMNGGMFLGVPESFHIPHIGGLKTILGGSEGRELSTREKPVLHVDRESHLLGQHTIRLSPISTVQLNPAHLSFCLSPPHNEVYIPILLNNSNPTTIRYSISALGTKSPKFNHTLNAKDLAKIDKQWDEHYGSYIHTAGSLGVLPGVIDDSEEYDDEYENDAWEAGATGQNTAKRIQGVFQSPPTERRRHLTTQQHQFYTKRLEHTQSLKHITVNRPGVVRLEGMKAVGNTNVRLGSGEVVVVSCPSAWFDDGNEQGEEPLKPQECAGTSNKKALRIVVEGVAPLRLKWHKEINGKRESLTAEGLEANPDVTNLPLSQNVTVPIAVPLSSVGRHRFVIDSVEDGVGNSFNPSLLPQGASTYRSVDVIRRSAVAFKDCDAASRTIDLLKGRKAELTLQLDQGSSSGSRSPEDSRLDTVKAVNIQYVPPPSSAGAGPSVQEYRVEKGTRREMKIAISEPGTYTILGAQGADCASDVLSPDVCKVVQPPEPSAEVHLETIHECSGDVGVRASLVLHGTPPFIVYYTERQNSGQIQNKQKSITGAARAEIILQPESSGTYKYEFTQVSDRKYRQVPLRGPGRSITQVVHPLASADFVRPDVDKRAGLPASKKTVGSCGGKQVTLDVDLRGTAPWTLELQVAGPTETKSLSIPNLTKRRSKVQIAVPEEVDVEGGTFQVDLVSVVDANGCKRTINVPGITVNVQRVKPTVRFYSGEGSNHVIMLQGETAVLPLRLTGVGPWTVRYRNVDQSDSVRSSSITSPNGELRVTERGTYELLAVDDDTQCPGEVKPQEGKYTVDWVPKPTISFSPKAGLLSGKTGSIVRRAVCEGSEDYAELELSGRPPYQIGYTYSSRGGHDEQLTFNSVQSTPRLQLRTSSAGHHTYRITGVGDAAYPAGRDSHSSHLHQSQGVQRKVLEQDVVTRPTASFKSLDRLSYCLGDPFAPRSQHGSDGLVVLSGQAPFTLELSIKNFATNEAVQETVTVAGHEWKVNLPFYHFDSMGPILITIDNVKDSSACAERDVERSGRYIWVDVAETAAIVPFDRKTDFCVGEPVSFQLEGTPPWTVKYAFNRHTQETQAMHSKFTRVPDSPGTFKILSIAHQQNMCKKIVDDIEVAVHPIPKASVSLGEAREDVIREGDQATITFDLSGTPPFTFTYQRTELVVGRRSKAPKILETHTVSALMSKSYSIFSALEGVWTVTFIADKYCRYPPSPPDGFAEAA